MPSATSSQTIGPYWHLLEEKAWADLTRFGADGELIRIIGTITDGDGAPVSDACVELWQADPPATADFVGFGRCGSDAEGNFHFTTLKPGPVPGHGNQQQA
ncbi:MAG: protocatechuate 3,4-dioxygenase subunit alpha, partial [Alphaproteobacteria bacterium]|nr:protocatechuate 3,4-dioxygenase subunit alpha [Alphaproteobacteria bacterium]